MGQVEQDNPKNCFVYFTVIAVNFISFATGNAYSWTSPVLPKLTLPSSPLPHPITTFEESWLSSLLSLGAAVGPIAAGMSSDRLGRKNTLLLFALPMLACHVILAFTHDIHLYFLARFLLGLGCGCVFCVLPNYVSEISENHNRGLLGCIMGLMLTLGALFNYVIGPYVGVTVLSITNMAPIVLFLGVFGVFMPETPYYLVAKLKEDQAKQALSRLRPYKTIDKELMIITKEVEESKGNHGGFKDLFKSKALVKGLIISCGLMVFQQFSGITAVLSYMQTIFDATGSSIPPEISVMVIGAMQFLMNTVTTQLVDRLGRRILLLISTMGTFISLSTLGLYFYLQNAQYNLQSISWLPILSLIVYILTYNAALGVLPWTIMGELFPSNVKSLACTITSVTCLVLAFLITMFFPHMALMLGMATSFWLFAVTCAAGFVFTLLVVPETKGKSLQEIQEMLGGGTK